MVGVREKGIYGEETAQSISEQIKAFAMSRAFLLRFISQITRATLLIKFMPQEKTLTVR